MIWLLGFSTRIMFDNLSILDRKTQLQHFHNHYNRCKHFHFTKFSKTESLIQSEIQVKSSEVESDEVKSIEVKWSQVIVWKSYSVTVLKCSQIILCSVFFCFISFLFNCIVLFSAIFNLATTYMLHPPTAISHTSTITTIAANNSTLPLNIFSKIESIFQSEFFADAANMFCIVNRFCFCTGIF